MWRDDMISLLWLTQEGTDYAMRVSITTLVCVHHLEENHRMHLNRQIQSGHVDSWSSGQNYWKYPRNERKYLLRNPDGLLTARVFGVTHCDVLTLNSCFLSPSNSLLSSNSAFVWNTLVLQFDFLTRYSYKLSIVNYFYYINFSILALQLIFFWKNCCLYYKEWIFFSFWFFLIVPHYCE